MNKIVIYLIFYAKFKKIIRQKIDKTNAEEMCLAFEAFPC